MALSEDLLRLVFLTEQNSLFPVLGNISTLWQVVVGDSFLWRTCLGKEVGVGREWAGKEGERLSRKTDRKMHPCLRSGEDVTFHPVGGGFYIMRSTGLIGQQTWDRAAWFNVMPQTDFTLDWSYMCSPLSLPGALCWLPHADCCRGGHLVFPVEHLRGSGRNLKERHH